jgi:benzoate/toluate 1,2-dioxygenase beta subunit
MLEWRRRDQRMLGGQYTHRLRRAAEGFRIVLKRVDLIDCEAVQDTLETFL